MAEIEIQRKKRPVWPWIVGAIAAILLLWLVIQSINKRTDKDELEKTETDSVQTGNVQPNKLNIRTFDSMPGQVVPFLNFAFNEPQNDPSQSHVFTHQGLQMLTEALFFINDSKSGGDGNRKRLENIRMEGEKLMRDPSSNLHSDIMRNSFIMATEIMSSIQQKSYPSLKPAVDEARKSAEAMDANKPAMEQQATIKNFFKESGDVVEAMAKEIKINH